MVLFVLLGLAIQICGYVNPIKVQEQVFELDTNVTPLKINLQLDTGHVRIGNEMVDKGQIKRIIHETLTELGDKYAHPKAQELIFNTGLVESKYTYLMQKGGKNIARGFFQCEPWVAVDICLNYLKYRPKLMKKVSEVTRLDWQYFQDPKEDDWRTILTTNIIAQVIMCRIHYFRIPKPLPNTLSEQSVYWKSYYNGPGKGTTTHFKEIVETHG